MKILRIVAAALLAALVPSAAFAHAAAGPAHGLAHGFAHPFLGGDHILAMLAVGLWAAQCGGRSVWLLPLTFVTVMVLGGSAAVAGMPLPAVEAGILASVIVLGALVALAVRAPLAVSASLVALFGLFHGHAHGAEMPASVAMAGYGAGFAAATVLLHGTGMAFARITAGTTSPQGSPLVRSAGAVVVLAGGVLLLL
jgi:urease accessory protein